jgi:hypothetical protein
VAHSLRWTEFDGSVERREQNLKRLWITAHCFKRMAQRNITVSDALETIRHGRRVHRAHADFYVFLNRCVPEGREREFERLKGIVVVVGRNNERSSITTAYRNRNAIRRLKKKARRFSGSWTSSTAMNVRQTSTTFAAAL